MLINQDGAQWQFGYRPPSASSREATVKKAADWIGAILGPILDENQEAILTNDEWVCDDARQRFQAVLDAYPDGPQRSVTLSDYKDRDPKCKFNALFEIRVEQPGEWKFSSDVFFRILSSTGEQDDIRHDIEASYAVVFVMGKDKAGLTKATAWLDLQGLFAKTANIPLHESQWEDA
jgi:hypothetical protein